jgi:hypothetical protein
MEYVATAIGVEVGNYYQNSWNFHAYTDIYDRDRLGLMAEEAEDHDYYSQGRCKPYPLMRIRREDWDDDLDDFLAGYHNSMDDPLFSDVAVPMFTAWQAHKAKDYKEALRAASGIEAHDWRLACEAWLNRKVEAKRIREMHSA